MRSPQPAGHDVNGHPVFSFLSSVDNSVKCQHLFLVVICLFSSLSFDFLFLSASDTRRPTQAVSLQLYFLFCCQTQPTSLHTACIPLVSASVAPLPAPSLFSTSFPLFWCRPVSPLPHDCRTSASICFVISVLDAPGSLLLHQLVTSLTRLLW